MKRIITLFLAGIVYHAAAQEIAGHTLDIKNEPINETAIQVYSGRILKSTTKSDFDGFYVIKSLAPGIYNVLVIENGHDSIMTTDVPVFNDQRTVLNFNFSDPVSAHHFVVNRYQRTLVSGEPSVGDLKYTNESGVPRQAMSDVASNIMYYQGRRPETMMCGPRISGLVYVIDGVQARGSSATGTIASDQVVDRIDFFCITNPGHWLLYRDEIQKMPASDLNDLLSLLPGAYQQRRGDPVQWFGGRVSQNDYIIDGMHMAQH